ncbi:MAG: hypothetical protein WC323_01250 [Patescibacteria group bacterium]|jgi:nitrogen regulatory protein PII-like uncharacterized protein
MALTPEQFNQLVTKEEHQVLEKKVDDMSKDIKQILTVVDGIAKQHETFEEEKVSNQAAHDRMQGDISMLKKHAGMLAPQ